MGFFRGEAEKLGLEPLGIVLEKARFLIPHVRKERSLLPFLFSTQGVFDDRISLFDTKVPGNNRTLGLLRRALQQFPGDPRRSPPSPSTRDRVIGLFPGVSER